MMLNTELLVKLLSHREALASESAAGAAPAAPSVLLKRGVLLVSELTLAAAARSYPPPEVRSVRFHVQSGERMFCGRQA